MEPKHLIHVSLFDFLHVVGSVKRVEEVLHAAFLVVDQEGAHLRVEILYDFGRAAAFPDLDSQVAQLLQVETLIGVNAIKTGNLKLYGLLTDFQHLRAGGELLFSSEDLELEVRLSHLLLQFLIILFLVRSLVVFLKTVFVRLP